MENSTKRVSILLTIFNGEAKIKRCLESILRQTYENLELVIFDDGSTDNTRKVIHEVIKENVASVFLFSFVDRNIGRSAALNRCLEVASGGYIAIMDADDEMHPDRIAHQAEYLDNNPAVSIVGGAQLMHMADGTDRINQPPRDNRLIKAGLFVRTTMLHPTVMFRKYFLDLHNIKYDTKYHLCEDYKIFVDLLYAGSIFANLPEVVNTYDYSKEKSWDRPQDRMVGALRNIWAENLSLLSVDASEEHMKLLLKLTGKCEVNRIIDAYHVCKFFLICLMNSTSLFGGKYAFLYARLKDIRIIMKRI